jgi:hypothetical protein
VQPEDGTHPIEKVPQLGEILVVESVESTIGRDVQGIIERLGVSP